MNRRLVPVSRSCSALQAAVVVQRRRRHDDAVHELLHKRHAVGLHTEVRRVLAAGGSYLVCDHFAGEGGMNHEHLYMSVEEQQSALRKAGLTEVELLLIKGVLVRHRATARWP